MKINLERLLLTCIVLFFLITRLYKISEIPPSVYWDEASIGYNAFSLAQTVKDEWGEFLPIHFRAFGEFKLPVYIYSVVLFVKIFGLNAFSVRIPAVLFSLGVVILTYLLAKRISNSHTVALLASFFIIVSPWFFIFSRTGYEATAGLMFYLLAIYLFLIYTDNKWFLLLSAVSFILSAYSYNSFRVVVPITLLVLIILEFNNLRVSLKKLSTVVVFSTVILVASIFPIYRLYAYDVGSFRFQAVGVKSGIDFFTNYLSHFSPGFLFINGDKNLRSQQANFGQFFLPDLILIITGILYTIGSKSKYKWLPVVLLLVGPIPASLTKESPHALRSFSVVPFYAMLSADGVFYLKKFFKIKYLLAVVVIIYLGFFMRYFVNFMTVYPAQSSKDWQYGYKKIFTEYRDKFVNYDRVIVSDQYAQPYIFALFYLQYDPDKFRQQVVRNAPDQWGFSTVKKFDKFEFGKVDELMKDRNGKILIFANEFEVYEK